MVRFASRLLIISAILVLGGATSASAMTKCKMTYDLKGWSVFYKTSRGTGRISCSNGQAANVAIVTHGGGLTFGKSKVTGGTGTFSEVQDISHVFGSYGEATAHAGAGASSDARVMFKDDVSLSLAGTGQGINIGVAFGSFKITRR
jgi:hypothetical protein